MALFRDASRTRKAYSYFRPRPNPQIITTNAEFSKIMSVIQTVSNANEVTVEWNEIPIGNVDGSNKNFVLAYDPLTQSEVLVFVNGVLQVISQDLKTNCCLNGRCIEFLQPPRKGSVVTVTYPHKIAL
jgi:hypothetical protein